MNGWVDRPSAQATDAVRAALEREWGIQWNAERARDVERHFAGRAVRAGETRLEGLEEILNGETHFFRYPLFLQVLLHRLRAFPAVEPFRVLSAACSSGEEAYSVAYTLAAAAEHGRRSLEIVGLDLRPAAIRRAREAVYGIWSLRGMPEPQRSLLLERIDEGHYQVRPAYRRVVRFEQHNLLAPLPSGRFDAILLCNATLYMHAEAAAQVYRNVAERLKPGGLLMLAPTDPAPGPAWCLHAEYAGWPIYSPGPLTTPPAPRPPAASGGLASAPSMLPTPALARVVGAPRVPAIETPVPQAADEILWNAWAEGDVQSAAELVRQKVFFEPGHPLWRFLQGVVFWERGWLRRAHREIERAAELLAPLAPDQSIAGLCSAAELERLIAFWRQRHE